MNRDTAVMFPTAFLAVLVAACCAIAFSGCLAPVTVNVFSSRLITAQCGTNAVQQRIDGGANVASNSTSATAPASLLGL